MKYICREDTYKHADKGLMRNAGGNVGFFLLEVTFVVFSILYNLQAQEQRPSIRSKEARSEMVLLLRITQNVNLPRDRRQRR